MDKIQRLKQEKQYEEYVKQKTPQHNVWLNMLKAFLLGGTICFIGQVINHYCELKKLSADDCSSWTSLLLVLLSVLLTGTGIYPRLAKWGGAGALVPITGFANSVAAPAIEYKKEGQVFGIGCKIFYSRSCYPVRYLHKLVSGNTVLAGNADRINSKEPASFCFQQSETGSLFSPQILRHSLSYVYIPLTSSSTSDHWVYTLAHNPPGISASTLSISSSYEWFNEYLLS